MAWLVALAALALTGVSYQALGSVRARRRFPPPGHFIDVGGHRVHAVCAGDGTPVVLLESGVAASSLSWARVQPALAAFTRACAYDRAGLAWSDAPSRPRTIQRILDELDAVVADAALRRQIIAHGSGHWVPFDEPGLIGDAVRELVEPAARA